MKTINYTLIIFLILSSSLVCYGNYSIVRFDNSWCNSSYPTAYASGSFSITETDINGNNGNNGLTKNQSNKTIQIDLPAGFEFKTIGSAATITASGTEITIVSFSFLSVTRLSVTLSTAASNVEYNTLFFNNFEIRAMSAGANGNILRTGGTFKIDNSSGNPTSLQPFGILSSQTPFVYTTSSVAQPSLGDVKQYSINNDILQIKISGTGSCGTTVNQFTFSTNGNNSTGTDTTFNISKAKVYYTGNSSVFSNSNAFGVYLSPNGMFTITGSADLVAGDNYFWLTYDVPGDAYTDANHNQLDASLISFVINGAVTTNMSNPSPVGFRKVIPAVFYYSRFSGNWTDKDIWAITDNGPSCNCQPNGGGIVVIDTNNVMTMNITRTVDVAEIHKDASLKGASASLLFTATTALNTYNNGYFSFPGDITVFGNVTLNGTGSSLFQKNFNIDGDLFINRGASLINSTASSLDLTIGGNLTIYGVLQDAATNNIVMDGGNSYIDGTGSILSAKNVVIKKGDKTVKSSANLYIESGFLIQGASILDNYGKMNIRGNMDADNPGATWINEDDSYLSYGGGATMFASNGLLVAYSQNNTVNYSGTTNQNIVLSEFVHYYNVVLEGSGTKTLLSNVHLHGNLTTNAPFNHNGKTITFHGDDMEYIYGTVPPTFYDMVMLNSGPGLTLQTPVYIDDNLVLTLGKVYTSMTNLLTVKDNAISTGGSVASFVNGPMKKAGDDIFVYPVGKDSIYARIGISAPQNLTSEFIAEYFDNAYANTTSVTAPLDHVSNIEYWNIFRNIGSDSVTVKLYWENASRSGINDYSQNFVVAGWSGASWFSRDQSAITASDPGNLTSTNVKLFGPFTFGSKSPLTNPLPIVFVDYNAEYANGNVNVTWSTASEVNNDYYTIEKSIDLNEVTPIGTLAGAGNSNVVLNYRFVDDNPGTGTVYYRIRQTDYDGKTDVSKWMQVGIPSGNNITVVGDNASGNITVSFNNVNEDYIIRVFDITGNCIAKTQNAAGGESTVVMNLSGVSAGIYIVNISSGDKIITKKIQL